MTFNTIQHSLCYYKSGINNLTVFGCTGQPTVENRKLSHNKRFRAEQPNLLLELCDGYKHPRDQQQSCSDERRNREKPAD